MNARDELAKILFRADNWRLTNEEADAEWDNEMAFGKGTYCHVMADAALAAGYKRAEP